MHKGMRRIPSISTMGLSTLIFWNPILLLVWLRWKWELREDQQFKLSHTHWKGEIGLWVWLCNSKEICGKKQHVITDSQW